MTDRRPLIVVLALFVAMIGFVVVSRTGENGSSATTTVSTTTTTAPAFGRGPDQAAPSVADWEQGLRRITAVENELFSRPDPARVGEIMSPSCSCHKDTVTRLTALKDQNHRVDGDNIVIVMATLIEQTAANRVDAYVVIRADGKPTVDSIGKVVSPSPTGNVPPYVYTLEKQSDGRWLLADRRLHEEVRA